MKKLISIFLALVGIASAQNTQVLADTTTGLLFRPSNFLTNATNALAIYSAIGMPSQSGQTGKVLGTNGAVMSWVAQSGGGGTPGGSTTQVQFNLLGAFAGDADMTFVTDTLTVTKIIAATSFTDSGLTSGRVPFASTGGLLADASTLIFNSGTGALTATTFIGALTGNATTATALATTRTIGGSNFDGTGNVTSFPVPGAIGGTTPAAGSFTTLTSTDTTDATTGGAGAVTTAGGIYAAKKGVFIDTITSYGNGNRSVTMDGSLGSFTTKGGAGGWNIGIKFLGSSGTMRGYIAGGGIDDTFSIIGFGSGTSFLSSRWLDLTASLATLYTPLTTGSQIASTVATGTAPLVVASTTLVSNLYTARAALADTTTTNANQTGDVTSVGNATTIASGVVTDAKLANAVKPAVAVVATANLTLSGEQTIDGTLTSGSLVLATGQSTGAQNGPWVTAAGAWARPAWYASGSTTQAQQFLTTFIRLGTLYQGSTWRMTTAAVTIDTTTTAWVQTPMVLNATSVTNGVTGTGAVVLATAPQISTIELGAAADTTLARSAAGVMTIEGNVAQTINRQTFSNADVTIAAGTTVVAQTGTMSAARTATLPAASSLAAGNILRIIDPSGTVTGTNAIIVARAGSDTINGGSTSITMGTAYGYVVLESDGSSKWTVVASVAQPGILPLTDGATITWTLNPQVSSQNASVTLGGNRTLAWGSTPPAGYTGVLKVTQDGTGSRTLALPANSKVVNAGAGVITLTTTAGAVDIITFWSDGTNTYWNYGIKYN